MKKSHCPNIVSLKSNECSCDYFPPTIEKLIMKITKGGKVLVKINGKGKWIPAEFNSERKTISFYS